MERLVNGRPIQLKSNLLGLVLLLPACFTAGQMYQRVNPYSTTAGGLPVRGTYPSPQAPWAGRRWNSVQQLPNTMKPHESQRYASSGVPIHGAQPQMNRTPVNGTQPQMNSSQTLTSPTFSVSSQTFNSQGMARNGTSLYQAYNPYDSRNIVPSYPGGSSSGQPQSSESVNSPVVPEGGRQSFSRHSTSPGGANSSVPNSLSNGGVPTNGFSGLRPMTNRPSELNIRYPGSRYTQSGRTTSSFMGIASGDPYSSYSRYGQGSQMANQPAGDVPESSSTSSTSEEEPQPAETEDESAEAETSGRLGERRVMNPYDLSHIFPDIYQDQQPASYENMTNQSLALLEMTTINSDPEGE